MALETISGSHELNALLISAMAGTAVDMEVVEVALYNVTTSVQGDYRNGVYKTLQTTVTNIGGNALITGFSDLGSTFLYNRMQFLNNSGDPIISLIIGQLDERVIDLQLNLNLLGKDGVIEIL